MLLKLRCLSDHCCSGQQQKEILPTMTHHTLCARLMDSLKMVINGMCLSITPHACNNYPAGHIYAAIHALCANGTTQLIPQSPVLPNIVCVCSSYILKCA